MYSIKRICVVFYFSKNKWRQRNMNPYIAIGLFLLGGGITLMIYELVGAWRDEE